MTNILIGFLTLFLLGGCTMTATNDGFGNHFVRYDNLQLISAEDVDQLSRQERSQRIMTDMEKVGFASIKVTNIVDSVTLAILSIYKNQHALMQKYQTIVDNHKDVMSFLHANKDKNQQELTAEINRFDSLITSEKEKIGPRLKTYHNTNQQIQAENKRLQQQLSKQAARLGKVLFSKENTKEMLAQEGLAMLLNAGKLNKAYKQAEIRIHLSTLANDFINDEKAVLQISKQIQSILDSKL